MSEINSGGITELLKSLSDDIDDTGSPVAIILAAGHGKRIKSLRSKMLHEIWGEATVVRVANAASEGLQSKNQIIVVGKKAKQVAETVGKAQNRIFVLQKEQKGTGDAAREALTILNKYKNIGDIYIFPGDMGLITPEVVSKFKSRFEESSCGMKILTGVYKGNPYENTYGRIIRVPEFDISGTTSGEDKGKVIEIKEHRDIIAMQDKSYYNVMYNNKKYRYLKEELLNINEYNTGVYAVNYGYLKTHISKLSPDNIQGELYLTDMISLFNRSNISVGAYPADDNTTVIGFNVKSVLHKMESIYRRKVWIRLRDIIFIEDEDDFFIADEVVEQILKLDSKFPSLDVSIGKGVHIGKGVKLNRGVVIKSGSILDGNIILGEGSVIQENVSISTYPHQKMLIGKNCVIMRGDIIKGNINIGDGTRIESSVNMTGSDEYPIRIGNNVTIKGTSYIFGSVIEDNILVEHSILKCKKVEKTIRKDGNIQPVKWVMPPPQGLDIVTDL
ncbi:MAG: multidrug transporter [Candidatus Neomarinimicrobiota bacterium]|nr:MAG: multidrug transporter [Candidatus Neomarinimicrobiota bacterium]